MSSNDELNVAVAEALGWKRETRERYCGEIDVKGWGLNQHLPLGHHARKFYAHSYQFDDFSRDLSIVMRLLDGHGWVLHTCDQGYLCQIHEAPENGEAVLGNGVGATPAEAICRAFLEMKKGKAS